MGCAGRQRLGTPQWGLAQSLRRARDDANAGARGSPRPKGRGRLTDVASKHDVCDDIVTAQLVRHDEVHMILSERSSSGNRDTNRNVLAREPRPRRARDRGFSLVVVVRCSHLVPKGRELKVLARDPSVVGVLILKRHMGARLGGACRAARRLCPKRQRIHPLVVRDEKRRQREHPVVLFLERLADCHLREGNEGKGGAWQAVPRIMVHSTGAVQGTAEVGSPQTRRLRYARPPSTTSPLSSHLQHLSAPPSARPWARPLHRAKARSLEGGGATEVAETAHLPRRVGCRQRRTSQRLHQSKRQSAHRAHQDTASRDQHSTSLHTSRLDSLPTTTHSRESVTPSPHAPGFRGLCAKGACRRSPSQCAASAK